MKQGPKLSVDAFVVWLLANSLCERESVDPDTEVPCESVALDWGTGYERWSW